MIIIIFYAEFDIDSIYAVLFKSSAYDGAKIKAVRTKQWFELPTHPYAVRVSITNGNLKFELEIVYNVFFLQVRSAIIYGLKIFEVVKYFH